MFFYKFALPSDTLSVGRKLSCRYRKIVQLVWFPYLTAHPRNA